MNATRPSSRNAASPATLYGSSPAAGHAICWTTAARRRFMFGSTGAGNVPAAYIDACRWLPSPALSASSTAARRSTACVTRAVAPRSCRRTRACVAIARARAYRPAWSCARVSTSARHQLRTAGGMKYPKFFNLVGANFSYNLGTRKSGGWPELYRIPSCSRNKIW